MPTSTASPVPIRTGLKPLLVSRPLPAQALSPPLPPPPHLRSTAENIALASAAKATTPPQTSTASPFPQPTEVPISVRRPLPTATPPPPPPPQRPRTTTFRPASTVTSEIPANFPPLPANSATVAFPQETVVFPLETVAFTPHPPTPASQPLSKPPFSHDRSTIRQHYPQHPVTRPQATTTSSMAQTPTPTPLPTSLPPTDPALVLISQLLQPYQAAKTQMMAQLASITQPQLPVNSSTTKPPTDAIPKWDGTPASPPTPSPPPPTPPSPPPSTGASPTPSTSLLNTPVPATDVDTYMASDSNNDATLQQDHGDVKYLENKVTQNSSPSLTINSISLVPLVHKPTPVPLSACRLQSSVACRNRRKNVNNSAKHVARARRASARHVSSKLSKIATAAFASPAGEASIAFYDPKDEECCADTGATDDMFPDFRTFVSYRPCSGRTVTLGDETTLR